MDVDLNLKKKLINDICQNQPCHFGEEYCILKEILVHDAKYSDRLLKQFACVNKFKYELGIEEKRDVGWPYAWIQWVERGYAAKFAEFYKENISFDTLYKLIAGREQKN